ncbi:MAG: YggS family pyridoxal phosphate-dependent enzyme [Pseudomonadota bacterium]
MTTIENRLQAVRARIDAAARRYGRLADEIRLLAVSKTWPTEAVLAAAAAGQLAFGENYVQEASAKMDDLAALPWPLAAPAEWHFIGPLQRNKTRSVAERFAWVHTVDRLSIAERLSAQRPNTLPPLAVCLQVNVSAEASKHGLPCAQIPALAHAVAALPRLRLRGLMAIPQATNDFAAQRLAFAQVRTLYESLRSEGLALDTLSLGMSHDLEAAIAEGANLVRVGTAIFGERVSA